MPEEKSYYGFTTPNAGGVYVLAKSDANLYQEEQRLWDKLDFLALQNGPLIIDHVTRTCIKAYWIRAERIFNAARRREGELRRVCLFKQEFQELTDNFVQEWKDERATQRINTQKENKS